MGEPLPPELLGATLSGHAIEARLYAEDVPAGFLPASGPVHRLHVPGDVRVDAGYVDGTVVSTYYDAMLAKVVAWAPTRAEATRKLADALDRAELHGVVTNRDLLVNTLRHDEFLAGQTDTGFYERHVPEELGASRTTEEAHRLHAHAAVQAMRPALPTPAGIPRGWRNVGPRQQPTTFDVAGLEITIESDAPVPQHVSVHHVGDTWYVDSPLGHSVFVERPRFPLPGSALAAGSLVAPMPGLVVDVLVAPGEAVVHGQAVVVLEAMKMQHTIAAPHDGTVTEVLIEAGAQVDSAQPLVVID
jgi:acyl-CoA carboxylase subunit alpha